MLKPIAMCKPLPPLVLRLAMIAPIRVSKKTETGVAVRRYLSTFNVLSPSVPRNCSISMISTSCAVVNLSFK